MQRKRSLLLFVDRGAFLLHLFLDLSIILLLKLPLHFI
jgi:hypothetical protein